MSLRWQDRFQIKNNRWVYIPTTETKREGRKIKGYLSKRFPAPKFYFHLREGGHVAAIKSHMQDNYFLNTDIHNFFGAINKSRVTRALKGFLPYDIARDIATLSTVRSPESKEKIYHLPYGFPQSTIIASICLHESALGKYLQNISRSLTVSVYVDDITISGNSQLELGAVRETLIHKSERSRLQFGDKKDNKVNDTISAFNIQLMHQSVALEDFKYDELRSQALLSTNKQEVAGILSYIRSVNECQYLELASEIDKIKPL